MSAASDKAFIEFERAVDEALDACSRGVETAAAVYDRAYARDGAGEEVDFEALGIFKRATAEAQTVCDKVVEAAHAAYKAATVTERDAYYKGLVQHLKNAAQTREHAIRLINESERSRLQAIRDKEVK